MVSVDELISGTPLEYYFDEDTKNRVRVCTYKAGTSVRIPDGVLFLMEGTVSFTYGNSADQPSQLVVVRAFNSIGELQYYYNRTVFDIVALEDSVIVEVPLGIYRDLEDKDEFLIYMLKMTNKNLLNLNDKMSKRNGYRLENYLAFIILTDQLEGYFYYKSMTALALVFNVSRRNLYYAVDSLVDKGLISRKKGCFKILDEAKLKAMV